MVCLPTFSTAKKIITVDEKFYTSLMSDFFVKRRSSVNK